MRIIVTVFVTATVIWVAKKSSGVIGNSIQVESFDVHAAAAAAPQTVKYCGSDRCYETLSQQAIASIVEDESSLEAWGLTDRNLMRAVFESLDTNSFASMFADYNLWRENEGSLFPEPRGSGVLIEPRVSHVSGIELSIENFLDVMPRNWIVQVFHSNANGALIKASPIITRFVNEGRVLLHCIHLDALPYPEGVDALLTSRYLWDMVLGDFGFIIATDTVLCENPRMPLSYFMENYDYVGAAFRSARTFGLDGVGGIGGFSLRRVSAMRDVVVNWPYVEWRAREMSPEVGGCGSQGNGCPFGEDEYFIRTLLKLGHRLPSWELSQAFGVERVAYDRPVGVHVGRRGQSDGLLDLTLQIDRMSKPTEEERAAMVYQLQRQLENGCPQVKIFLGGIGERKSQGFERRREEDSQ